MSDDRGLRIDVDGTYRSVDLPADSDTDLLAALQDAVGGWVEAVPMPGVAAWCDEDGLTRELPQNTCAEIVLDLLIPTGATTTRPGPLVGPVVFTGPITSGRVTALDPSIASKITTILDAVAQRSTVRRDD